MLKSRAHTAIVIHLLRRKCKLSRPLGSKFNLHRPLVRLQAPNQQHGMGRTPLQCVGRTLFAKYGACPYEWG
eukprot:12845893-Heterocapsa_arctica.AAC.1